MVALSSIGCFIFQECDSKPVMTSAKFDSLVIKHKAELRNKYEKMTEQQKKEQELSQSKQESVAEDTVPPCESESAKPEESGVRAVDTSHAFRLSCTVVLQFYDSNTRIRNHM